MSAPTVTKAEAERAAFIGDLRTLADWLDANPWAPTPITAYTSKQLNGMDDVDPAATLTAVRQFAEQAGVKTDESLPDRTRARVDFGRVEYQLLCWHPRGRPGEPDERDVELERLRAEVEALRAATTADASGLGFGRGADDPTPVSPARITPHVGDVESQILNSGKLVGEPGTGPIVTHELTEGGPFTRYFSFGMGHTDPLTGEPLRDKYVTVIAPTVEGCREAMLASRFGRQWAFEYTPGRPTTDQWIPRWTEHERIVVGADPPMLDGGELVNDGKSE